MAKSKRPPQGAKLLVFCYACQDRYEGGREVGKCWSSDAVFHLGSDRAFPKSCPRCGSTNLNTAWTLAPSAGDAK